jgi:predicted ATPase/class 3 adenylate cyclase
MSGERACPAPDRASVLCRRMGSAMSLPTGTITFLFTDIEGSTQLWEQHPDAMRLALARHDSFLRAAIESNQGHVFKTIGDAFCAAFANAADAVDAAIMAQQSLHALQPSAVASAAGLSLKVRIALHTGAAEARDGDYFGPALNRVARMLAVGYGGQVLLSQTTQDLVQDDLPRDGSLRDLGSHRLRDLQRPEQIYQLLHPDLPLDFPPLRSLSSLPNNLPQQVTSFVGREEQLAEVRRLLGCTRLLTLTGPGGTGKTRLSLQVAAEMLEGDGNGVWLVELAPLTEPNLVPQAVALVLGVREEPGRSLVETLVEHLRSKRLLLILDNCEHLLAACATLANELLHACPHVQILASSREGLGIAGETTYRLPSLQLPDPDRPIPVETLTQFEAVRLFIDRAAAAVPSFAVTNQNASAVAQVCHRLDGIPLAIELAAARVKVLPVEKIAERLDDRFRLLTGGSRTALPRQQTLRALIDWSYDLLAEPERMLLRRLSVFAGGWTMEAAEAVCAGDDIEAWDVLDLLSNLVDKSLVVYEEQRVEARYRFSESMRQYARERLLEAGEEALVRGRHRDCFLELAGRAEPELLGAAQAEWLDRLETEHDNLRTALGWSLEQGDAATCLAMGGALWRFWHVRGHLREGRERLEAILAMPGASPPTPARAKALNGAGALADDQGDSQRAAELHGESLAIARECDDRQNMAYALLSLGHVAIRQGEYERGKTLYEEALGLWRSLGTQYFIAVLLHNLGSAALYLGQTDPAISFFEESLALKRKLGNESSVASTLNNLGYLAIEQGNHERAAPLLDESLRLYHRLGNSAGTVEALNNIARVALETGDLSRAVSLLARVTALSEAIGAALPDDYEQNVAAARTGLGEEPFAAAWSRGQAMSLEQAIESALSPAPHG